MVKHIVLFKLKDEVSAEEKLVVMNKFKEAIEALPAKIAVIRKVEVGRIHMPPFINGSGKYNLRFCVRKSIELSLELYRIFDLRLQNTYNKA